MHHLSGSRPHFRVVVKALFDELNKVMVPQLLFLIGQCTFGTAELQCEKSRFRHHRLEAGYWGMFV